MLKELRKKANITQKELAEKLQVTQSAVSSWESGDKLPRKEMLYNLCEIFACKVDDIIMLDKIVKNDVTKTTAKLNQNKVDSRLCQYGR